MSIVVPDDQLIFGKPLRYWWATIQNVVVTFVLIFLTLWLAPVAADWFTDPSKVTPEDVQALFDWSVITKAAVATVGAFLSFVKSLVAGAVGNRATPSFLPASLDPATPPPAVDPDQPVEDGDGSVDLVIKVVVLIIVVALAIWIVTALLGGK